MKSLGQGTPIEIGAALILASAGIGFTVWLTALHAMTTNATEDLGALQADVARIERANQDLKEQILDRLTKLEVKLEILIKSIDGQGGINGRN